MDYLATALILSLLYFILAVSDFYTTMIVLESGKGKEANPLMAPLTKNPQLLLYTQIASWIVFSIIAIFFPQEAFYGLIVVDVLKALVVLNNAINGYAVWSGLGKLSTTR